MSDDPARAERSWVTRAVALGVALAVAMISGLQLWRHHEDQMTASERLASALARAAEEKIAGSLRGIDLLLQDVAAKATGTPAPDESGFTAYLDARAAAFPEVQTVFVASEEGITRFSTRSGATGIRVMDRAYFQESRANKDRPSLYLSEPLVSRAVGSPLIFAARPILDGAGEFRGVAVATLRPQFFYDAMTSIATPDVARGFMMRKDGTVYVRLPEPEKWLGSSIAGSAAYKNFQERKNGFYRSHSVFDGVERLVAFQNLKDYPVAVAVGIPLAPVFAAWRNTAFTTGAVVLLLAISAFALAFLHDRRRIERQRAEIALRSGEERLRQRTEELERSNAELRQFAHVAAHDLQEPLRNITNYMGLLERRHGDKLDAEGTDSIRIATTGARRMHRLIRDLREFVEVGWRDKPPVPSDLDRLLADALAALGEEIDASGARITHAPLPTLTVDGSLMQRVFRHLLENAIRYRRPDRPPLVHVGARQEGREWVFSVADNGIGIAPEYFERIFRVFQRLHTPEAFEGTGIGLALCKKIVEHHGGRVWVESTPAIGSTFFFTLPA